MKLLDWDNNVLLSIAGGKKKNIAKDERAGPFLKALRAFVPKEGDDFVKAVSVAIGPGKEIKTHRHPEWTVLYYVDPCETPIIIGGAPYLPQVGEVLVLEPNADHSVPKNVTDRVRIKLAMLVEA